MLSADVMGAFLQVIMIDVVLSGDNAVVIALAARSLPPHQQKQAIMFGSGAAVVLRILLTVVAAWLLELKGLQIIGGLLLLWIGAQLLGEQEEDEGEAKEYGTLTAAVRTILIADLVMSLDNVIAVAAGACDGLSLGNNARAALITRGLAEITRLGVALGANPLTFLGLAGVGDHGDRHELAMPLGERLEHGDAFGADGEAVGGVLDVAAGDNVAGDGLKRGADLEAGIVGHRPLASDPRRLDQEFRGGQ